MVATNVEYETGIVVERANSITELYPRLLEKVLRDGQPVAPRERPTRELAPFMFVLEDPRQSLVLQKARRLNRAYAIVEKLALVAGVEDPKMCTFYVGALHEFVNPCTGRFDGAYGPRVASQLPYIYELLRKDPDSRRAVIFIYGEQDQHESTDVPCTVSLQFLLRNGRLCLIANMRSSDIYLGLPYDVNQFCFLQQVMASWLGVKLGHYVHFAGSGHIYESDIAAAECVVNEHDNIREIAEPKFTLSYEETLDQLRRFFAIEETTRLQKQDESFDRWVASLSPELQTYSRELAAHVQKRTKGG